MAPDALKKLILSCARSLFIWTRSFCPAFFITVVTTHGIRPWLGVSSVCLFLPSVSAVSSSMETTTQIRRENFPQDFVFGVATASYQVEGAAKEGGRGPSIWDTFSHTSGKIADGSNGDIAVDQYHKYKEDVDIMAEMGMDAYRFSIAWPRIIPDGVNHKVNDEGIAYYNRLIDYLLHKGLKPYVTLYHWDLPQKLDDSIGGWMSEEIIGHFSAYAEACFNAFGDRVKHWITFNEPLQFVCQGYGFGTHAPGRTSDRSMSSVGNSSTDPYIVAHHVILAHATAVDIFRKKFQPKQGGVIGMTVDCEWAEPMGNSLEDESAALRRLEFQIPWFLDPIFFGDYPAVMRERVGDRLPKFSADEVALMQGSMDFVGINHYTSKFASPMVASTVSDGYYKDVNVELTAYRNGMVIGDRAASDWLYIVPWGLYNVLKWVSKRYNHPPMYITENGMDDPEDKTLPLEEKLNDVKRIHFYQEYLSAVAKAVRDGVDLRGYFAWSLVDNFEWAMGYTKRFGLVYVDYDDGLRRYPKSSVAWFTRFLKNGEE